MRPLLAIACLLAGAGLLGDAGSAALAGQFEFVPAPQTDLNRVYRIDRFNGEVGACQYGLKEGSVGVTLCYPAGEGATRQEVGEYGLVGSRHEREGGVYRVDYRTGGVSVCYVFNEHVVCTPSERGGPRLAQESGATPAPSSPSAQTTGAIPAPRR